MTNWLDLKETDSNTFYALFSLGETLRNRSPIIIAEVPLRKDQQNKVIGGELRENGFIFNE